MAIAELGTGTAHARQAREFVEDCFADPDFRVRGEAASSLARVGSPEAIPAIERTLAAELDGRARRRMADAMRELHESGRPTEQARKLHDEVDRLRAETAKLRERLEHLEARGAVAPAPAAGPGNVPPTTRRRREAADQVAPPPPRRPPRAPPARPAALARAQPSFPVPLPSRLAPCRLRRPRPRDAGRGSEDAQSAHLDRRLRRARPLQLGDDLRAICRARAISSRGTETAPTTGWPPPP